MSFERCGRRKEKDTFCRSVHKTHHGLVQLGASQIAGVPLSSFFHAPLTLSRWWLYTVSLYHLLCLCQFALHLNSLSCKCLHPFHQINAQNSSSHWFSRQTGAGLLTYESEHCLWFWPRTFCSFVDTSFWSVFAPCQAQWKFSSLEVY